MKTKFPSMALFSSMLSSTSQTVAQRQERAGYKRRAQAIAGEVLTPETARPSLATRAVMERPAAPLVEKPS